MMIRGDAHAVIDQIILSSGNSARGAGDLGRALSLLMRSAVRTIGVGGEWRGEGRTAEAVVIKR